VSVNKLFESPSRTLVLSGESLQSKIRPGALQAACNPRWRQRARRDGMARRSRWIKVINYSYLLSWSFKPVQGKSSLFKVEKGANGVLPDTRILNGSGQRLFRTDNCRPD